MEIIATDSDWIFTDAERLATFLDTDTGKRLIAKLVDTAPPLLASGDVNAILIRSGEVRGISGMIQTLMALAHPAPPSPSSSDTHPPLEDDAAWNDGQKLEPVVSQPTQ